MDSQETKLPDGAVQVHLYNVNNMLRPRGSLEKESLSADIKDKLEWLFQTWTNPTYGDSIEEMDALKLIHKNLMEEVNIAFGTFLGEIAKIKPELVAKFLTEFEVKK